MSVTAESWRAEKLYQEALHHIKGRSYERAKALLVEAIHVAPSLVEAWVLRGNILMAEEQWFDALLHFDRAIGMRPGAFDAWNNRGTCLGSMGRWDEAEAAFKQSAELKPAYEPYMGLASMCCTLLRLDEAAANYAKAAEIDRDPDALFNLGVTLMGMGRWREGFEFYKHRWATRQFMPDARERFPQWEGQTGKILIYAEQGYGDEIMAARFAHMASRDSHNEVWFEARAPFARLAKTIPGLAGVITRGDAYPEGIQYSCAMLDLPMVLGLDPLKLLNDRKPYLRAPFRWTKPLPAGVNVGLCWASGAHLDTLRAARAMKSIPIQKLAGLVMPGVNLISLQKPAEPTPPEMRIIDWTDELNDLADTAALIAELDLVITADTAVAHLAGAMGKPVWNLVRFSGYWPWLAPDVLSDPSVALYYESMMLFRQTALNDWSKPIADIVERLRGVEIAVNSARRVA